MTSIKDISNKAAYYLSRREYSRQELTQKLSRSGFELDNIETVLDDFEAKGWLSDARFVEAYMTARHSKGMGPARIRQELHQKGASSELIEELLDERDPQWLALAKHVFMKKFSGTLATTFAEKAKQMQYLQYRGFTEDQIRKVVNAEGD